MAYQVHCSNLIVWISRSRNMCLQRTKQKSTPRVNSEQGRNPGIHMGILPEILSVLNQ